MTVWILHFLILIVNVYEHVRYVMYSIFCIITSHTVVNVALVCVKTITRSRNCLYLFKHIIRHKIFNFCNFS